MKIGFFTSEYPTVAETHGGIGSMTQNMARHLAHRGHAVSVYTWTDDSPMDDRGVRIVPMSHRGALRALYATRRRIARDLERGEIDVIEAPECNAHLLPAGRGTAIRMNGSHHFWCATLDQKMRPARIVLEQVGIRSAHGLCAVSQYTAALTRKVMRLGGREIDILPNPIDTETFVPKKQSVVPTRVVFAGSITEKKGIRELCQSMQHVLRQVPDAELHVAGRDQPGTNGHPSFRDQILQTLDEKTSEHIRFLGALPLKDTAALMATAGVCVFPSYMETMGMVIAEAMACSRPVVTTNRGPGPEVLGPEGECGFLAEPTSALDIADKIVRVLSRPEESNRMGQRGRLRAEEHFSAAACLPKNLSFYEKHAYKS